MSRRITSLAAALAVGSLVPSLAAAQEALDPAPAALALGEAPVPAGLKATYHLVLTSTWPQEQVRNDCRNGGVETVEGTLIRGAGGGYTGSFTRRTELLFCGAHGESSLGAESEGCALTLTGEGSVAMTGVVVDDQTSPSGRAMRATWIPDAAHGAAVSGACPAAFKQAVRAMYLSTPHAAEFPLTTVGSGPMTERLENYAWTVELE
jgi:hypothetical protein